jgi:hypothetical protein
VGDELFGHGRTANDKQQNRRQSQADGASPLPTKQAVQAYQHHQTPNNADGFDQRGKKLIHWDERRKLQTKR